MSACVWKVTSATYAHVVDVVARHSINDNWGLWEDMKITFGLDPNGRNIEIVVDDRDPKSIHWPNPSGDYAASPHPFKE